MNPYEVNDEFPFEKMALSSPNAMQGGGAYFTKITANAKTVYVQLPRCSSKSGIVATKRSCYIDLTYDLNDCEIMRQWLNKLEAKSKTMIDEKKALWFSGDVTKSDIESMMASVYREITSTNVMAIRCKIDTSRRGNDIKCKIYDENEMELKDINEINKDSTIIPLIALEGIKFTGRSIDLEMKVVQMMILDKVETQRDACLIKRKNKVVHEDHDIVKIDMAALRDTEPSQDNSEEDNDEISHVNNDLEEVDLSVQETLDTSDNDESDSNDESSDDEATNTSQATSIVAPEGLEEITLTVDENENIEQKNEDGGENGNVKGDVTLGSLTDLPDELIEEAKKEVEHGIKEIQVEATVGETIKLKQPQEVYIEIYRAAKEKAKKLKQAAMEAYLEVKQIKTNYMLEHLDDSEDEDFNSTK